MRKSRQILQMEFDTVLGKLVACTRVWVWVADLPKGKYYLRWVKCVSKDEWYPHLQSKKIFKDLHLCESTQWSLKLSIGEAGMWTILWLQDQL